MATAIDILDQANQKLSGLEDKTLDVINDILDTSYSQLESALRKNWKSLQSNRLTLSKQQQLILLLNEVKQFQEFLSPKDAEAIQKRFETLFKEAGIEGGDLAETLMKVETNKAVKETAGVPIGAIASVAQNTAASLSNYTEEFKRNAVSIIGAGLATNQSFQKIAGNLQTALGVTKSKALMITRTETIAATVDSMKQSLNQLEQEYGVWVATADDRSCPWCVARNGNVYRLGDMLLPAHPNCRCFLRPFVVGVTSLDDIKKFSEAVLEEAGPDMTLNPGLSAAEKRAGLESPAKPLWTPSNGFTSKRNEGLLTD